MNLPALEDITEKGYRGCVELTFFGLGREAVLQESLKYQPDMLSVFCWGFRQRQTENIEEPEG